MSVPSSSNATAPHGRIVASAFRPHPLLSSAHAQTIIPSILRPRADVVLRRERLELPDGDFVDLGWGGDEHRDGPIAVMVHGLGGGLESKYLRGLAWKLVARGWRVCGLQLRGAGRDANRLPRAYHQGDTADLRYLWQLLRKREPRTFVATVGWSLGGNITLKALGEEGEAAATDVVCAVSVPFRLRECAVHLKTGFARVYQNDLLSGLKDMVRRKHAAQPVRRPANFQKAMAARDFFEFDNAFTAPLNGFADAEDYYARATCRPVLKDIRRPTLVLHAADDPFMSADVLPDERELSPHVTIELSGKGGHVGFVSAGALGIPRSWSEWHVVECLTRAVHSGASRDVGCHATA